jgi:hypothetical protein
LSKLSIVDRVPSEYNRQVITAIVRAIEQQVNQLSEGSANAYHGAVTGIPTSTAVALGDWAKEASPVSGGYFGYVYTTTGWKGFGLIA